MLQHHGSSSGSSSGGGGGGIRIVIAIDGGGGSFKIARHTAKRWRTGERLILSARNGMRLPLADALDWTAPFNVIVRVHCLVAARAQPPACFLLRLEQSSAIEIDSSRYLAGRNRQ